MSAPTEVQIGIWVLGKVALSFLLQICRAMTHSFRCDVTKKMLMATNVGKVDGRNTAGAEEGVQERDGEDIDRIILYAKISEY